MTPEEAIKDIVKTPKYYIGVMSESKAYSFMHRYRKGKASKESINAFLAAFGYEIKQEELWGLKNVAGYIKVPKRDLIDFDIKKL